MTISCRITTLAVLASLLFLSSVPSLAANGGSVRSLSVPARGTSLGSNVAATPRGVFLTWIEDETREGQVHRLQVSRLTDRGGDLAWSEPVTIDEGTDFWPNWADLSALTFLPDGRLLAHRLKRLAEGAYDYGIELLVSDSGEEWRSLGLLHADGVAAEHGFVSWVPGTDGTRAFWLDGRQMPEGGAMTLRTARVTADGSGERIQERERIDARVCECCQTDAAAIAGGEIVVYRDRSDAELRDIWRIRRQGDGWSEPAPVWVDGWELHGCPVNGPAVTASGDSVWVAWYTAADDRPRVQVARSSDGGASFEPPVVVDGERPLGRVELVTGADGGAWLLWLRREDQGASVRLARLDAEGIGDHGTLLAVSASRRSGFPRAVRHGDDLVLTWTELVDDRTEVRSAIVEPKEAVR